MKSYRLLVLVIAFNLCLSDDPETVEVKLKHGTLSGKVEKTILNKKNYYSFKSVPYAEPPVGKLRFKPPLPHQGWEGTYEAYNTKPTCFQFNTRSRAAEPLGISGSEDCLYISIFTPNLDGTAPVIVFDYTDNFRTGFNGTDTYSPDFLIEEDVIVVTISHRLGLLGYLTTEDDVIPPNNCLKDFILGLNWVKDNINAFGGDAKRVTLMGNRGGAVLADILLRTEKAKDLFSGVILQSGTALEATFFASDTRKRVFEFGKLFNITTDDSATLLEELQKIKPELLIEKEGDVYGLEEFENLQLTIFPFTPIIENNNANGLLTSLPENSKIVNDVPVMIGMNSREGLDLIAHFLFEPRLVDEDSGDLLFVFPIRSNFKFNRKSPIYDEAIRNILDFYFKDGIFYMHNILEYAVYVGDMLQNYALNFAAKTLSGKLQSPVYYYMFDFKGYLNENMIMITRYTPFALDTWGATIVDELCYLHVCSRIKMHYEDLFTLLTEQNEMKLLKKMVRLWANFAKTRNPTPNKDDDILKDFKWNPIEKGSDEINYLRITKNLQMKVNPLGKREQFWDDFLAKYSQRIFDAELPKPEAHEEL